MVVFYFVLFFHLLETESHSGAWKEKNQEFKAILGYIERIYKPGVHLHPDAMCMQLLSRDACLILLLSFSLF